MTRSEKISLLNLWKAGKISLPALKEKLAGTFTAVVVIYKGSMKTGPFFIDGKEYNKQELEDFLTPKGKAYFLPQKHASTTLYLPDNGR